MTPVPILTHTWSASGNEVRVTVTNLGSADAYGAYVKIGFDAGNNQAWNQQQSPIFNLGINQKITATFTPRVPYGQHTRLIVQILLGGYVVDESYSDWFNTNPY